MIRFVDLGNQLTLNDDPNRRDFAFFDTVSDTFCTIEGYSVFESVAEFGMVALGTPQYERYLSLIPKDHV